MTSQKPTPNDDRSNTKNPTSPAYEADRENRENLGHENVPPPPNPQPSAPSQGPKK